MPTHQQCPLCDRDAMYKIVQQPDGKLFTCAECGELFIDTSSEAYIAGMPDTRRAEQRTKLQREAKSCRPNSLFVMRAPRPDEIHGDGKNVARETMIWGCVSNGPHLGS